MIPKKRLSFRLIRTSLMVWGSWVPWWYPKWSSRRTQGKDQGILQIQPPETARGKSTAPSRPFKQNIISNILSYHSFYPPVCHQWRTTAWSRLWSWYWLEVVDDPQWGCTSGKSTACNSRSPCLSVLDLSGDGICSGGGSQTSWGSYYWGHVICGETYLKSSTLAQSG